MATVAWRNPRPLATQARDANTIAVGNDQLGALTHFAPPAQRTIPMTTEQVYYTLAERIHMQGNMELSDTFGDKVFEPNQIMGKRYVVGIPGLDTNAAQGGYIVQHQEEQPQTRGQKVWLPLNAQVGRLHAGRKFDYSRLSPDEKPVYLGYPVQLFRSRLPVINLSRDASVIKTEKICIASYDIRLRCRK